MKNICRTKIFYIALAAFVFSLILIPIGSAAQVEEGDWIKIDFTISGAPSGTTLPEWIKIETLSVEGTTATILATMHMSDTTEQNGIMTVDLEAGGGTVGGLSGLVIPANSKVGDSIDISGYDTLTFDGESTRTYAGASRTVVYASVSEYGMQLTYYWDKETGIMVEASGTSGGMTITGKATGTNMWEAGLFAGQELWILIAVIIIVVVVIAGSAVLLLRRRRAPLPEVTPAPTE